MTANLGEIRELSLSNAVTEVRLLVDEARERARSHMLQMDFELEQTRSIHREARRILLEITEDRRRLQGILQRAEAILGLLEQLFERIRDKQGPYGQAEVTD